MSFRQELPLEQQFELQVFEQEVRQLSQEDAHNLLVKLREAMLYQSVAFQEILKDSWGLERSQDSIIGDALH